MKKFVIKKSEIEGKGIFALENIRKNEIICIMDGEIISIQKLKRRYASGEERICDPLQISERQYLDLIQPYIYFNHSCDPNAGIRAKGIMIAIKDINIGDEITYDYSTTEWTWDKFGKYKEWEMNCNCGSLMCRKKILQFPLLPQDVKNKYLQADALQDFIIRKLAIK